MTALAAVVLVAILTTVTGNQLTTRGNILTHYHVCYFDCEPH